MPASPLLVHVCTFDMENRYMINSTPDETSHGGLIHITYWMATGAGARVPPTSIIETEEVQ